MNIDYNFAIKLTTACPGNCKCCVNRKKNFEIKKTATLFDIGIFEKICKNINIIIMFFSNGYRYCTYFKCS